MPAFFNRLFNIRSNEWPRVTLLFVMAFIAITGITWGKLTVQPLFWEIVGIENLGYSFIAEGLLAIFLVAVYTPFADRLSHDRLLIIIAILSAAAVGFGRLLLAYNYDQASYFLLYPLFTVIPFILNLHWWTYVTGFYTARAAKRIVPVLASNARLAGAFAGFSVASITALAGSTDDVITLWALSLIVLAALVGLTPFLLRETKQVTATPIQLESPSYLDNVREGYNYVRHSSYLRWLAIATLFVMLLFTFLKFQSSAIINAAFQDDTFLVQQFSSPTKFLGQIEGIANLLMLPVQLFLLSRLISKIGLSKANLIFPAGALFIALPLTFFSVALLTPGLVIFGTLAYLTANVLNTTFRNPVDNLLYNAVPLRIKGRARAFVNGMLVPLATLSGGLLVLLPLVNTNWFMPGLISLTAVATLIASTRVSREYSNALINLLEQEDYSFLLGQEAADLTVTDPAALQFLKEKLDQSTSDEFTLFMITLISDVGGSDAVPIVANIVRSSDAHIRAAALDILAAADVHGTAVHDLYREFLHDSNPLVRHSALAGLERLDGRNNKQYLQTAAHMLADEDIAVRTQALPALLRFGDLSQREQALKSVRVLLSSQKNQERAYALRALGQTEDNGYTSDITAQLQDPADMVRLEAALILEAFSKQRLNRADTADINHKMAPLLHDPVERTRAASLSTLARTGNHDTYPLLVESLNDSSSQIQETAVDVLTDLGKKVIPVVHTQLDSPNAQLRKMATVILARINRREYGPLITAQIQANLLHIVENVGYLEAVRPLNGYPSITILQNVFQEKNSRLADEIFFLLTAVQDKEAIQVIRESLSSDVERVQANALEALESLTSPQTADLIAHIINPEAQPVIILQLGQETWDMQFPTSYETMQKLSADYATDPWPRAIAVHALGEIGLAVVTPPSQKQPEPDKPKPARKRPRSNSALLDSLIDDTPAAESRGDKRRKARRRRVNRAANLLDELADDSEPPASPPPKAEPPPKPEPASPPTALETMYYPPPTVAKKFTITRVLALLHAAASAPEAEVRQAAQQASDKISGKDLSNRQKEGVLLSNIERIIFLKEVLFFREMNVDQLKVLASVCEESFYEEDAAIYKEGDAGGVLYVVVRGKVGIERESRRGTVARLATIESYAYFGEMNLFDGSSHTDTAVALQDTLTLKLRREPLIALARQYPDLSLELINVLSQRLRETTDQIARLTKSHPRALHKVLDQLE
ncbi:MAG: cyclic nucleotide-binding domain-containing protein [Chloroflexi bacterium]|nr:cyclic nucleotide-binding domain-containing protein [Chloroflexota bacterium]